MTTLVKSPLLPELDAMERSFRRIFEGIPMMPAFVSPVTPAADVYETPEEIVFELEVPGYEERELGLELSDHRLTITGERTDTKDETTKAYRIHERLERQFQRTFALPPDIDSEHVSAEFEKGVLKVHAPKLASVKPRQIPIGV
jgi:HSP20 family molecular chaperone IbpA